jgi:8-amino-7-oxononanoate synthase
LLRLQARLRVGVAALLAAHPDLRWQLLPSDTPIQPLVIGDNVTVMQLSAQLERLGLRVPGIRPPTVPAGTARLRITLCASHSEADIDRLLQALATVVAEQQTAKQTEANAA